jgi:hypothetical protein
MSQNNHHAITKMVLRIWKLTVQMGESKGLAEGLEQLTVFLSKGVALRPLFPDKKWFRRLTCHPRTSS